MSSTKSFYVVACSAESNGGIYRYECNGINSVKEVGFTAVAGCNYVVFSPCKKYAYATINNDNGGGVVAFKVGTDYALTEINRCESKGTAACHLTTDRNGKFLFCANYMSGSFSEFTLNSDGSIGKLTRVIEHSGSGPHVVRQTSAHVHQTILTPDGKFLSVVDLGIDMVKLYALDDDNGVVESKVTSCKIDAGQGPRHVVFNATGDIAYLLNELGNTVSRLNYNNGEYTLMNTVPTLPATYAGFSKASSIRLSLDGKYLLASNRGCDTFAVFKVLDNGDLERQSIEFAWGESPRDLDFVGDGSLVAINNENNDNMSIYAFDKVSGAMQITDQFFELPHPLCVLRID